MSKITLAVRTDELLARRIKTFCREHGLKQGFFVEKALREQLAREEYLEDLLDLKRHKPEEKQAVSFEDYLRKRHV